MIAPMLMMMEVLNNLVSNGNFDSVSIELEADNFLSVKHTALGYVHERSISLDTLPVGVAERETTLLKWIMQVNVWAEESLTMQARSADATIH